MADVSIIIPAHNRTRLLRQTVASCLLQRHPNCEVIVVDDGSTEPVSAAVEQLASLYGASDVLRCIRQEKGGANAARNRGLEESSGDFIQFVDSDDLLHPEKISTQLKMFERSPELDMVFALDEYFKTTPGDMRVLWNVPSGDSDLDRFIRDDPVWNTGSPLWTRATLERLGPWDESLVCWQDWEFHVRALSRGLSTGHVPAVLQYIRDHDEARSTNLDTLLERTLSKFRAATMVVAELKAGSLLTQDRRTSLGWFLLSQAVDFAKVDAQQHTRTALVEAGRLSRSTRLTLLCHLLSLAQKLPDPYGGSTGTLMRWIPRAARKSRFWPDVRRTWKVVSSAALPPDALIQALEELAETELHITGFSR